MWPASSTVAEELYNSGRSSLFVRGEKERSDDGRVKDGVGDASNSRAVGRRAVTYEPGKSKPRDATLNAADTCAASRRAKVGHANGRRERTWRVVGSRPRLLAGGVSHF